MKKTQLKRGGNMQEQQKVCLKCNISKPLTEFRKTIKNGKTYYRGKCKSCTYEEKQEYYKNSLDQQQKARDRAKRYRQEHLEEIKEKRKDYFKEYNKKYYDENKEYFKGYKQSDKYKEQQKEYRQENKEQIATQNKKYKQENHDEILEKRKKWDKAYRETHKEERKEYIINNRDQINKSKREYHNKRVKSDPLYKFEKQIRGVIISSFTRKQYKKNGHTYDIIGLTCEDFIKYLLKTFKDNYGYEWDGKEKVHIDHITPLATANTEQEILDLCYYTNLQLLKEKDNLKKKDKTDFKLTDDKD